MMKRTAGMVLGALAVLVAMNGAVRADFVTGLVGQYTFESNNANDTAGTNNGADVGSPVYIAGPDAFRGTVLQVSDNNYVEIPNMPVIPIGNSSRTMAIWAKVDNHEDGAGLWHHGANNGQQDFSMELRGGAGNFAFNGWSADFNVPAPTTGWHQFVVTHDGSDTRAYVDGVEGPNSRNGTLNTTANIIRLGGQRLNNSNNQLDGQLDDFRIYDRALSPTDIGELYAATAPPPPVVFASDFGTLDTQGWSVLNGGANFRTGDGRGVTPALAGGGEAMDNGHPTFLFQSPEFKMTGATVDGTNALKVTFAGGAGDQNGDGPGKFSNPGQVVAYNGGNSNNAGQKGLAFYNVGTGQYDTTIFENDNGNTDTRSYTPAQLSALGVDLGGTYRLHYFENDDGGWGWGQLNSLQVAAEESTPPAPIGGPGYFGIREVKYNGTISNLADAKASLASGGGKIYDGKAATINFADPNNNGGGGHVGGNAAYLSDSAQTDDQDFIQSARGKIRIAEAGDYTFYARGDDGFELRIVGQNFTSVSDNGDGTAVIAGDTLSNGSAGGNVNGFGVINLPVGDYLIEYLWFERAGGAYNELFAAKGVKSSFDGDFALVGQPEVIKTAGTIQPGGWDVTVLRDGANNLGTAISQIEGHWGGSQPGTNVATGNFSTINLQDSDGGGGGHGQPQQNFPGDSPGGENDFAVGAKAQLKITDPGTYTFMVYGDDGSQFRLLGSSGWSSTGGTGNAPIADGFQVTGCCQDVFGIVDLAAGTYPVEFIWNEIGGGAYVGVWGAYGEHTSWDPDVFQLLGENIREVIPGGLELVDPIPEPATMAMLGLAVTGLAGYVRRRRRA